MGGCIRLRIKYTALFDWFLDANDGSFTCSGSISWLSNFFCWFLDANEGLMLKGLHLQVQFLGPPTSILLVSGCNEGLMLKILHF